MITFVRFALSALVVCVAIKGLIDLRRGRVHLAMGRYVEHRAQPRAFWAATLLHWSGLAVMTYAFYAVFWAVQ